MAAYTTCNKTSIDGSRSPLFQNLDSDFSSGYLEDALLEFTEMSKRRRLLSFHGGDDDDDDLTNSFNDLAMNYMNSENFSCMNQLTTINGVSGNEDKKKNKRVIKSVVYPFALVKPGGIEGDMTLNDINQRLLMPPTRPIRHPVGDSACRPCMSADGTGLSGKAVTALTKIYTKGSGSITIIRTKG
ncbi:hypothetical protein ERO13_A04G143300v2 [Gossypium hirsutum]|uniref:Uncharacterized protein isoform X1 n=2 Tax=Gossypium TaxID=3633 RepID=A0ABM3BKW1_GOSHI|nr:uncharacterized protein LOC107911568 isoform X1 [Gossypium hirsutum]KAG4206097.1 hypothetical protein ERO13_A04G143300v2 [Gossypium hirsutum]TYJ41025.1 hypothetical protein E1A91_A04G183000v1 [Gossypium mustelinum]